MVNDLKQYKFAKTVCKDMSAIIPRVQACIQFLEPYKAYSQVVPILNEMYRRLEMLKAQNKRYSAIVKEKGKR
jgi:hypothetical protein